MTLNATLVVQMGNFFITWCIIRYLFMNPALKIRAAAQGELNILSTERDGLLNAIQRVKDQEYSTWHLWQLQAHKSMKDRYQPQLHHEPISVRVPTPEIPPHEIEKITDQLTQLVHKQIQELP